jgi:RNA polymerase sigma-70 factor (ECF subfamily)
MGWIRRIVVNTCIDHCRRQVKFARQSIDTLNGDAMQVDPDVYKRFSGNDIIRLLQELPRNTALVFNLFVMEGYKHEEIGQLLGIAAGTSKWHLNEARRLLKNRLDTILKTETYSNAI